MWGVVGPQFMDIKLPVTVKAAETGEPIPYASVNIAAWRVKGIAGSNGKVELVLDGVDGDVEARVSCVGYKTKTVSVSSSPVLLEKGLEVELEIDPIVMEEIVVMGVKEYKTSNANSVTQCGNAPGYSYYISGCVTSSYDNKIPKEKLLTTIKDFTPPSPPPGQFWCAIPGITIVTDTATQQQNVTKAIPVDKKNPSVSAIIYPNPVTRGETITIDFKGIASETIMVKLLSADGKTLILHRQPISKGNNRFTITTDPAWTTGIYFLVFSNEKGILIKTEEVLIQ
jgi:hypothetical protein